LVVGAEKMYFPDKKEEGWRAFRGGLDIYAADETVNRIMALGSGIGPTQPKAPESHSVFMDVYAALARFHMKNFGTTVEQIAAVASKNHFHSTMNPLSQYQFNVSVQQVLEDRLVAWPLTRSMCAPISDGAAAAVICGPSVLARFNRSRAVRIHATVIATSIDRDPTDFRSHIGHRAANMAYEMAGLGPGDMSVAEVHDASAFAEIQQVENLGFCGFGEGGYLAESGDTQLGGRIPVNTSGGLISRGHPVGATGLLQLHELVLQLRGEAGARQVPAARFGIAENGGGLLGIEEAVTTVTILGPA
jgi:acetyl-CoA acetyltransferase